MAKAKKIVKQHHHISYKPELIVPIKRSEHWALMRIQRYKYVSWGMITSLIFEVFRLGVIKLTPLMEKEFTDEHTEGT